MSEKVKEKPTARSEVYDWLQCIVTALVFCVLLFVFVVRMKKFQPMIFGVACLCFSAVSDQEREPMTTQSSGGIVRSFPPSATGSGCSR